MVFICKKLNHVRIFSVFVKVVRLSVTWKSHFPVCLGQIRLWSGTSNTIKVRCHFMTSHSNFWHHIPVVQNGFDAEKCAESEYWSESCTILYKDWRFCAFFMLQSLVCCLLKITWKEKMSHNPCRTPLFRQDYVRLNPLRKENAALESNLFNVAEF